MDRGPTTPHWRTEEYAAALQAWVEGEVGPVRMTQVKLRAWSTVWRAEGTDGVFWVKQNCPSQAFEGPLTELLARLTPGRVLQPVALRDDGALILPDGGPVLRDLETPAGRAEDAPDVEAWREVVGEWAVLQRDLVPYAGEIAAVGVTTVPPADVLRRALERAEELSDLDTADPRHLPERDRERIREAERVLTEAAEVVAEAGLPLALNHNDLHDGNAFVVGEHRLRFFDMADAVLGEPMAVLLVPFGQLKDGRARGDVARAWVDVWRESTDEALLWRVLPHALRLAAFARHEAWWRVMGSMTSDELAEWGVAAPYWLARLADPPPDLVVLSAAE